jgi:hypothetical protein
MFKHFKTGFGRRENRKFGPEELDAMSPSREKHKGVWYDWDFFAFLARKKIARYFSLFNAL